MRRFAALALIPLIAAAQAPTPAKPKTPSEIAAAAPRGDWREVPADDLLVFELQGGKKVVMQLAPDFRAGPCRQYSRAGQRRLVEWIGNLPRAGQLCRPVGQ